MTTTRDKKASVGGPSSSWQIPSRAGRDLLILGACWFASLLVVWPVGNFPLNDDWAYARSVKRLLETGSYYPTAWAAMPLFTQTLWGALFCFPAGFSFNALRCSTLVMSLAGVLFTYLALRYVHPSRLVAVLGALTLAFNPIYFALSYTFMTDVTFTCLMMGSALFFLRNLRNGSKMDLAAGSFLALAATLCRQLGLAIPLSFALCLLWTRGYKKGGWARAIAPLLLSIGGLVAYQLCMTAMGRLPTHYIKMSSRVYWVLSDVQLLLSGLSNHVRTGALYLGWFALPMSVLLAPRFRALRKEIRLFLPAAFVAIGFVLLNGDDLIHRRLRMPTTGNILVVQGIGPITLTEAFDNAPVYLPSIGNPFWLGVTALAVLGAALLLAGAVASICRSWRRYCVWTLPIELSGSAFFLISMTAYLFTILAVGGFDRYYMPALPLLLVAAAALAAPKSLEGPIHSMPVARAPFTYAVVATCLLISMGLFSVCATRDYLNWNRARWMALDELMASGKATPEDVDGGFEFNGWHLYDPHYKSPKGKNFWWVHRDDYLVAFAEQPGYQVIKEYPYSNWLPPCQRRILLLGKKRKAIGVGFNDSSPQEQ